MNLKKYYSFLIQLLTVLLSKGSFYIITIFIYHDSVGQTTNFFLMNSISAFLGPLILFGNGAIITKNIVKNKKDYLSSIIISYSFFLGLLFFILIGLFNSIILKTLLLSTCWAIFHVYMSQALAFDKFQTLKVASFKFLLFFLSIILLGYENFPILIFILLSIFLILKKQIQINFINKSSYKNIFKSSFFLFFHSLSRWILNSSDKLILSIIGISFINDYTFLYTLGSGISLLTNSLSFYLPRIIYSSNKNIINVADFEKLILFAGGLLNIILGFIYLNYLNLALDKIFGFIIISFALILNGFTVSLVSKLISVNKFKKLAHYGLLSGFISIFLFILFGFLNFSLVILSLVNLISFFIYYFLLKYETKKISI